MVRRLLLLNGLAIVGVVVNHSIGWGFVALYWWADRYRDVTVPNFDAIGSLNYWLLRAGEALVLFAIPAFLFVSGYFAAFALRRSGQPPLSRSGAVRSSAVLGVTAGVLAPEGPWSIVGSRIKALLIPYVIWSVIYLTLDLAFGNAYTPVSYGRRLALGGAAPGFYYVPLLVQCYLLAPFLVALAGDHWKLLLSGTSILWLAAMLAAYLSVLAPESPILGAISWLSPSWFFPSLCFWFVIGIVSGTHLGQFKRWLARLSRPALLILPLLWLASILEWEAIMRAASVAHIAQFRTLTDELASAAVIIAFLGGGPLPARLDRRLPRGGLRLQSLGAKSFGIYLTHALGLIFTAKILYHQAPQLLGHQLLFQPLLILAGLCVPLLLMHLVDHSPFRWAYKYLFG